MKASEWKNKITEAASAAGTYQPYFDCVIDTLADVLQQRDEVQKQYSESGEEAVIIHTNRGGSANPTKNPALVIINELNKTALQYWRDLGLTPAGLKRINEEALKPKKKLDTLAEVLADLGEELS